VLDRRTKRPEENPVRLRGTRKVYRRDEAICLGSRLSPRPSLAWLAPAIAFPFPNPRYTCFSREMNVR
jgi:hypothetical protein